MNRRHQGDNPKREQRAHHIADERGWLTVAVLARDPALHGVYLTEMDGPREALGCERTKDKRMAVEAFGSCRQVFAHLNVERRELEPHVDLMLSAPFEIVDDDPVATPDIDNASPVNHRI